MSMSQTTVQMSLGRQKIIEDIKVLLNDSEELVRLSASLPAEGVDALRTRLREHVDAARNALESSTTPLKTIAYECGFGTADRMRIVFRQRLGVSPNDYRLSFQKLGA